MRTETVVALMGAGVGTAIATVISGGPQRMFDTRDGIYKDVEPGAGKAKDGSGPPVNKYRWNLCKGVSIL